jgi:hypothetical protein
MADWYSHTSVFCRDRGDSTRQITLEDFMHDYLPNEEDSAQLQAPTPPPSHEQKRVHMTTLPFKPSEIPWGIVSCDPRQLPWGREFYCWCPTKEQAIDLCCKALSPLGLTTGPGSTRDGCRDILPTILMNIREMYSTDVTLGIWPFNMGYGYYHTEVRTGSISFLKDSIATRSERRSRVVLCEDLRHFILHNED